MILEDGRPQIRSLWKRMLDYFWGIFPALAALLLVVAVWQWIYESLGALVMPAPLEVFKRMVLIVQGVENQKIWATFWRGSVAISLALIVGMGLGFIAGLHRTSALITRPIITLLLGTPPIVWVVLAIFWFDMGDAAVIFTVWIVVVPLVFASAQSSLLSVPNQLSEMMDVYQISWWRQIKFLYLPHIMRQIFPAIVVAVGSGLKVTVMAELLGSNDGMGGAIADARAMLDSVDLMAYVMLIVSIIMVIEYGFLEPLRRCFVKEQR